MKKNMLVSVIMSVYREEAEWLHASMDSILNQSYRNIEFIVVLDDPGNEVLKSIIQTYQQKDARILFLTNDKNRGLVYSLNRALLHASGAYIARMDADDIAHPDRLEKQLHYLQEHALDLVGSNVALFNDTGIFFVTDKLLTHKYLKKILSAGTIGMVHPTFFGKKEVFDRLDGYVDAPHAEDKEFLARVFCHGFQTGNMEEVLLNCRYSKESVTKSHAVYVYKVGHLITKRFRECIQTGRYRFDAASVKNLTVTEEEKRRFNQKRIFLQEARDALGQKHYVQFVRAMAKAMLASGTIWENIRINLVLKGYKIMERVEHRGRQW